MMRNVFVNENTTAQRIDEHLNTNRYMPLRGIYVRHECVKCENFFGHNFRSHTRTHRKKRNCSTLDYNIMQTIKLKVPICSEIFSNVM